MELTGELHPESWLCVRCIGNLELRAEVEEQGGIETCDHCGREELAVQLEALAERIQEVYDRHFVQGPLRRSFDGSRRQEGETPQQIIQRIAGLELPVAEAIRQYLFLREDYFRVTDGGELRYGSGDRMVERKTLTRPFELEEAWTEFRERIRFGPRFFADETEQLLDYIILDVESFPGVESLVVELAPDDDPLSIYRARVARNRDEARTFLDDPATELGPPPPKRRKGGRLNPPGASVFYGGLSPQTCIAEVRPAVGTLVLVAEFEILRSLRLLDLTAFQRDWPEVSMFDPDYEEITRRWRFLRQFDEIISRPVRPREEFLEYIPTQAVAEYLHHKHGYDGLIYSSAQRSETGQDFGEAELRERNIALFDARGIVEDANGPAEEAELRDNRESTYGGPFVWVPSEEGVRQRRSDPPALRIVENSVQLHQVTAVDFETSRWTSVELEHDPQKFGTQPPRRY